MSEASSGVYTLALDTLPPGNVTITPSSGDSGAVRVAPASLTFTPSNWDTPQAVSVTGVDDDNDNNETVNREPWHQRLRHPHRCSCRDGDGGG